MTATIIEAPRGRLVSSWGEHAVVLGVAVTGVLLLFARDAAAIVSQWWSSSTYEHCLAIPPILAWLVWQRLPALRLTTPRAWAPALLVVAAGGFGWLLGEAAGVSVVRQFALLLMLQGAVLALLGPAVARVLAFPLGYAFFLVPAGDFLIPPLQNVTADICMALLHLVGIPAALTGVFITTPNGQFEVAAACSGAKFLIAMLALGVLGAHLCFRSWPRRAAFLAACSVVPILANGVRAWGTIYAAHFVGVAEATSFDHIVYGWFFFGSVIALMLAISWRFFDRAPWDVIVVPSAGPAGTLRGLVTAAAGALVIATLAPAWTGAVAAAGATRLPDHIDLPQIPGWHRVPATGVPWQPRFDGADHFLLGRLADDHGHSADLSIAVYGRQDSERRLVGYGHGAVDPDGAWGWARDLAPPPSGRAELLVGPRQVTRTVLSFYRVGTITTGSDVAVKLETLKTRMFGGPARAAALLISADETQGGRASADALLAALGSPTQVMDADATR